MGKKFLLLLLTGTIQTNMNKKIKIMVMSEGELGKEIIKKLSQSGFEVVDCEQYLKENASLDLNGFKIPPEPSKNEASWWKKFTKKQSKAY